MGVGRNLKSDQIFSWKIISLTSNELSVKVNFSNPEDISKQEGKVDVMRVFVNTSGVLVTRTGLSQDPKGESLTIILPQQFVQPAGYTGKY